MLACLCPGLHTTARNFVLAMSGINEHDVTIAEILKKAGYATGIFGKWGLGNPDTAGMPLKKGFDEFYGYLDHVHAHYRFPLFLYDQDKEEPFPTNTGPEPWMNPDGVDAEVRFHQKALDFLDRRLESPQPFFLNMMYTTPHADNLVSTEYMKPYMGQPQLPSFLPSFQSH